LASAFGSYFKRYESKFVKGLQGKYELSYTSLEPSPSE